MEKELLGKGRFGEVYKVTKDDETIALKEIVIEAKNKEKALILGIDSTEELEEKTQEVMKEISFLNDLKGDSHIVNYIDYYVDKTEDQYTLSIEMELLKQLDSIHDGILDEKDIKALLDDMLDALAVLEEHHIVHGDIKPSNIMVDDYGNYKLTDFGISKILGQKLVGYTKAYAPKEVLEEGRYTSSSDLYSLGLVIYQMFNKNLLPFMKDKDDLDSIHNRFKEELPRPEGMDNDFYEFLKTALNNNPEERYFSAKAMKTTLDYLYKENHIPAITISVTELLLIVSKLSITNIKGMEVKVLSEAIRTTAKAATGSAVKKGIIAKIASLPVLAKAGLSVALVISGIGGGYVINEKVNPSYDDLIVNAKEAILDKDYSEAQKYLDKAKDKDSKRYELYETLTKMYVRQGKGQKALDTLSTARTTLSKENYKKIEQYEKTSYYSIYSDIIKQLEKEYGKATKKTTNMETFGQVYTVEGLSFVTLYDYNKDGINELTTVSVKDQYGSIKIYTYNKEKNKVEKIFDKPKFDYFYPEHGLYFHKDETNIYLEMSGWTTTGNYLDDYTLKDSEFVITESYKNKGDEFEKWGEFDEHGHRFMSSFGAAICSRTEADISSQLKALKECKNLLKDSINVNILPKKTCDYSPYITFINSDLYLKKSKNKDKYILYDIDDDGIKELGIISTSTDSYMSGHFYKILNNQVESIGWLSASDSKLYIYKTNDELVSVRRDEEYGDKVTYISIKNNKLKTMEKDYYFSYESQSSDSRGLRSIKEAKLSSFKELEKLCK